MLTDTHCHLDFNKFDADRDEVLARAWAAGLTRILIPGITLPSSRAAVKLAESHPRLFAAVGIHPNDVDKFHVDTLPHLREIAKNPKVVAIGEIGLDYYWDRAPHDHQQKVLQEQLGLAAELRLPIILHSREKGDTPHGACAEDLMKILEEWVNRLKVEKNPLAERPGMLHSFSGTRETAQRAIQLGFYIGVTGPVTFKNVRERQEVVAALPLELLLIETDAPFLAPHPHRGQRNEPAFVGEIADKIAQLHSRNLEEVTATTSTSAAQLFSWGELD